MNKDSNLLIFTVRHNSWGTRDSSWLDQYILVLEANFIATELAHLKAVVGHRIRARATRVGVIKPESSRSIYASRLSSPWAQLWGGPKLSGSSVVKEGSLAIAPMGYPQMILKSLTLLVRIKWSITSQKLQIWLVNYWNWANHFNVHSNSGKNCLSLIVINIQDYSFHYEFF